MSLGEAKISFREMVSLLGLVAITCGCGCGSGTGGQVSGQCAISQVTAVATDSVGVGSLALKGTHVVQSFQTLAGADLSVKKVRLGLLREGWPTGRLTLTIQTDNNDSLSGVTVAPAATASLDYASDSVLQTSTFKTTVEWFDFEFTEAVTLTANKRFWLMLETSASANSTHYPVWAGANTNPYASGRALYENNSTSGTVYTDIAITANRDLIFSVCSPEEEAEEEEASR